MLLSRKSEVKPSARRVSYQVSCRQLKHGMQTLLGIDFAGLRKRFAFRYSWHRQQGSSQDSTPGMTESSLELILGTLEGLPCTAARSLLECKVTGNLQGSAHQGHERGVSGLPDEASLSSPAG